MQTDHHTADTAPTLRRIRRDGDHDVIDTAALSVLTSSIYPDRVTLQIGRRHLLRIDKATAAWLAETLAKHATH